MLYKSVLNSIDRGVLSPVYLICGDESFLQEIIITAFKNKLINSDVGMFNYDEIDGEKTSMGVIINSANTLPVFSEKRLVVVRESMAFHSNAKDVEESGNKKEEETLQRYLQDPLVSTCLVFWSRGSVDKRRKTVKMIEKSGGMVNIESLRGPEFEAWIQEEMRIYGKKIEKKALEYLLLRSSSDLRAVKNELNKLSLYAAEESVITLSMMEKLLTKTSEANIFALVDSIGQRMPEKAITEMRNLLFSGEPPIKIIFMIARQFRLVFRAKDMQACGYSEKKIAQELQLHPFVGSKILRQSQNYSFYELEKSLRLILECDVAVKTGSPAKQSIEDLVMKLAWQNDCPEKKYSPLF